MQPHTSRSGRGRRRSGRSRLDPADIRRLRERLLARREELYQQWASAAEARRYADDGAAADLADMAVHDGEQAAAGQVAEAASDAMAQVERALEKLDEGSYGTCDGCGARIPLRRLRAIPWATRCVACQGQHERERGESERPRPRLAAPFAAWDQDDLDVSFAGFRATKVG